jgi:YVTN family beta-propeller protein
LFFYNHSLGKIAMIKNVRASAVMLLFLGSTFLYADKPNEVVATIGVGQNPAGLAVTPDNLFAYVANNNNNGIPGGDSVSVLNLTNNTVETTISDSSFNEPYTLTINASGTTAYVTNSNSTTVTIINIATNTVTGTIGGFDGPSGLAIAPNGIFAYVNNYGGPGGVGSGNGTTVRVVNLQSNTIVGMPITVGLAPASLAVTPDGAYVYVINYVDGNPGTGTISIIRTSDNSVQFNAITGFSGPFAIAITPNGKYAYVTNFGSNNFSPVGTTVSAVDLSSNTIIATIPVGIQPSGLAITPAGSYAYVSNYNTLYEGPNFTDLTAGPGTISIIDIQTNKVVSPIIQTGLSPDAIAISPNGQFAYVTNYTSNTVNVIPLLGLYDINRLRPIYYQQLDETRTKLEQAGLL